MTVFLIYGEEDSGKTSLCRKLNKLFTVISEAGSFIEKRKEKDFRSLIKLRDCTISIYSAGDDQETLNEGLQWAKDKNCDYHIASIRKGVKYTAIENEYSKLGKVVWVCLPPKE